MFIQIDHPFILQYAKMLPDLFINQNLSNLLFISIYILYKPDDGIIQIIWTISGKAHIMF